jgi:hypothetical protein
VDTPSGRLDNKTEVGAGKKLQVRLLVKYVVDRVIEIPHRYSTRRHLLRSHRARIAEDPGGLY